MGLIIATVVWFFGRVSDNAPNCLNFVFVEHKSNKFFVLNQELMQSFLHNIGR